MVVRKPTTTSRTFQIPWLGLPHKAKSKTFGMERCLYWLLRMASLISVLWVAKVAPYSRLKTSYLQAKHIPWRFCGSFDSIFKHQQHLQSPNYGTAVKERKQTTSEWKTLSYHPPTHSHKWNFKTLKSWNGALFLVPWRGTFQWRATSEKEICR